MSTDSLDDALVRVRSLLIDLERHIDRGSTEHDLAEVGRAWVRAAQVERILRSVLPPDAVPSLEEVQEPTEHSGGHAPAPRAGGKTRRSG